MSWHWRRAFAECGAVYVVQVNTMQRHLTWCQLRYYLTRRDAPLSKEQRLQLVRDLFESYQNGLRFGALGRAFLSPFYLRRLPVLELLDELERKNLLPRWQPLISNSPPSRLGVVPSGDLQHSW